MAKASGTIDLKVMKEGHDDASTKATNYITEDETGIKVHNANDTSAYAHIDYTGMEVHQNNDSVAKFGRITRIGGKNGSRVEIAPTALEMISKDGATAIKIESSNQTAPSYISININIPIMYDTPADFELDNTITVGTVVTVEVLDDVGYFLPTDFTIGTAYTYTDPSGYTIAYDGSYSFTATCTQAADGLFTVSGARYTQTIYVPHTTLGGMVKIIDTPFNSYSLVAPSVSVTDTYNGLVVNGVSITRLLNSPNTMIDATGLTPYSSRVTISNGGVIKIGKWRFVQLDLKVNKSLAANNYWAVLGGFDTPVTGGHAAMGASVRGQNGGAISAYINSSNNLVIETDNSALSSGWSVEITGWYIAS